MKPFDLERAKAGDKVVTRDGKEFIFGGYNPKASPEEQVIGWVMGVSFNWYKDGKFISDRREYDNDLFMAPKEETVWIAIGREKNVNGSRPASDLCQSKEELLQRGYMETYWTFQQIEIEV